MELSKLSLERLEGVDERLKAVVIECAARCRFPFNVSEGLRTVEKQRDSYGRWIATAYLDGADIAEELLKEGLAWHYKEHDSNPRYAQLEAEARQDGRGLWCDDRAVPPWEWRRMSKYERDAYR